MDYPGADMAMETTETTGVSTLQLDGVAAGYGRLLDRIPAGTPAAFCVRQLGGQWEVFVGQLTDGGTGADTLSRTQVIDSSSRDGAGNPLQVNFGVGTKIVYPVGPAAWTMLAVRALEEIAEQGLQTEAQTNLGGTTTGRALFTAASAPGARTALGLGTIATVNSPVPVGNGGTGATTAPAALTALGAQPAGSYAAAAHDHGRLVLSGQSGGGNGKVVRLSGANTWVNADRGHTAAQLAVLAYRDPSGVFHLPGSAVTTNLTLVAGNLYWLTTNGDLSNGVPTPTSTVRQVLIGVALTSTAGASVLLFAPRFPIGGA